MPNFSQMYEQVYAAMVKSGGIAIELDEEKSYADSHFTVLGFMLATVEPLCCAV
jgi:hypothetical protein